MIDVEKISTAARVYSTSGLTPGDVIVAEGVGLLREGTPIVPRARPQQPLQLPSPQPKPRKEE